MLREQCQIRVCKMVDSILSVIFRSYIPFYSLAKLFLNKHRKSNNVCIYIPKGPRGLPPQTLLEIIATTTMG